MFFLSGHSHANRIRLALFLVSADFRFIPRAESEVTLRFSDIFIYYHTSMANCR